MNNKSSQSHFSSNLIWKIAVSVLSLILVFVLLVVGAWTLLDNNKATSSINVQGEASIEVMPDKATITLFAEEIGEDSLEIDNLLDQTEKQILDYLENEGIQNNKIKTNRSIYEDFSFDAPESETSLNRATLSVQITFDDIQDNLQKPRTIVQESLQNGVTRYGDFSFEFDEVGQICQELENKAIENALQTANQRIDSLGGGKIESREIISVQGCDNYNYRDDIYRVEEGAISDIESSLKLNPGKQKLVAIADINIKFK